MTAFNTLIRPSLDRVETILNSSLTATALEQQVSSMCLTVVRAGGKRLRPALCLLAGHALPEFRAEEHEEKSCKIAASIELLHTATLIHDDVIDRASQRRGQQTLNETYGNHAAVLAGDYLFTRCFILVQQAVSMEVMERINHTIAALVAGEIKQLERQGDFNLSIEDYYETIYCKTGALFELSAMAVALLLKADQNVTDHLARFGRELGSGFQIVDDMLDYSSDTATLGKNAGEDLADGRITLPVILTLKNCSAADRPLLLEAIKQADVAAVRSYIVKYSSLSRCQALAEQACTNAIAALDVLPDSASRRALIELAECAVKRNF